MNSNTILAIDPAIFENWTKPQNSLVLYRIYELLKLDLEKSPKIAFDKNRQIQTKLEHIQLNCMEKNLCVQIIEQILEAKHRPLYETIELESLLDDENITTIAQKNKCSEIQLALIGMACMQSNVVVVLPDPQDSSSLDLESRRQICLLLKREAIIYVSEFQKRWPFIITEGKTDWKHLKAALKRLKSQGMYLGLILEFDEYEERRMNSSELLKICQYASLTMRNRLTICIFDRDENPIIKQVLASINPDMYKFWGNSVYSFALPVPEHRSGFDNDLCIEFYYTNDEIKTPDLEGYRLFIGVEFDSDSGWNNMEAVHCNNPNKYKYDNTIIDNGVFKNNISVALSKNKFAEYILFEKSPYANFNFSAFSKIFDMILQIIKQEEKLL